MSDANAYQRTYRRQARLQGRTCQGCGVAAATDYWRVVEGATGVRLCAACKDALESRRAQARVAAMATDDRDAPLLDSTKGGRADALGPRQEEPSASTISDADRGLQCPLPLEDGPGGEPSHQRPH